MPINRLVAFVLGPAITLASGYISLWLSRHFPGAHLPDQKTVAGVLTSGVLTIVPMLLAHRKVQKWLDGWQQYEKQINDATHGALDLNFKLFLERVAAKTGVPLPTGEVLAEGQVAGADVPAAAGLGEPVAATETGPPQPPASEPSADDSTGDVFSPPAEPQR